MKRFLTAFILASTISGCGHNNIQDNFILPEQDLEISAANSMGAGTVTQTSYMKDNHGDHYGFNQLTVSYANYPSTEKILISYNSFNSNSMFISLTHNPGTAYETSEAISQADMTARNKEAELLKTLRTVNSKDKEVVDATISVLEGIISSSSTQTLKANSLIKYGTVLETSFVKDHNGDHYRFNHLDIKYITDTDVNKNLQIAYSLDNPGIIFIWLTSNPGTPDETNETIPSENTKRRQELAEMLKTLRTLNSTDKENVRMTVSFLSDFIKSGK